MEADSNEFYRNSNKLNMDFSHIYHVSILFSALTRMFPKPTFAP